MPLPRALPALFYQAPVLEVARNLLGMHLYVDNGGLCVGRIVETEAYGENDSASHAYGGKRTPRNAPMFAQGGIAYVYICYGVHRLFNVVCEAQDKPAAVLIRGIEPVLGQELMQVRRGNIRPLKALSAGPGRLSQAMGITLAMNTLSLQSKNLRLVQARAVGDEQVVQTTRIGVESAGKDALSPWRFYIKGNVFVSVY